MQENSSEQKCAREEGVLQRIAFGAKTLVVLIFYNFECVNELTNDLLCSA